MTIKKPLFALGTTVPVAYGIALLYAPFDDPKPGMLSMIYPAVVTVFVVTWVAYFIEVVRNRALDRSHKWLWAALLLFGTFLAEIAYFFIHIIRERPLNVT